jgi:hypothetical protein
LFNTVYNENVHKSDELNNLKKKGGGVHKSGTYDSSKEKINKYPKSSKIKVINISGKETCLYPIFIKPLKKKAKN